MNEPGAAFVIWIFGRPGAGKSTLAMTVHKALSAGGLAVQVLDGDVIRQGLSRDLGDAADVFRTILVGEPEVARLSSNGRTTTVVAAITPRRTHRDSVRTILGSRALLVHAAASLSTCARRDPKGLYARSDRGELRSFTGIDSPFDEPAADEPCVRIDTDSLDVSASAATLLRVLEPLIAAVTKRPSGS